MIQIGPVTLDFQPIIDAAAISPLHGAWVGFLQGGWIVAVIVILTGFKWAWLNYIATKYGAKWKWVLLEISVPAENIQSPKAVENILAHLAGAHMTPDLIEKYVTGFAQEYFSLEVVSVNGFVRFFIYTTVHMRSIAESSIYAQYPSAEIIEVEDYTKGMPSYFPDPDYYLWGTEFIYTNNQAYPIRTYEEFEDTTAEEAKFKDPMAALLETMSSMQPGEQLWFQIVITPISHRSWQPASYKLVAKLAGIPSEGGGTWIDGLLSIPHALMRGIIDALLPGTPAHDAHVKDEMPSKMLYLTPGEREAIEAIEKKAAKTGFNTKIRVVYLARKESTNKARGRLSIIGAMKQFTTEDLNALKPELHKVGTHAHYYFTEWRKNWKRRKIMRAYKVRSNWRGMPNRVMNVEELATIWHFPISESVKAPLVKKAESKRAAPPYEIPTLGSPHHGGSLHTGAVHSQAPANLPQESAADTELETDTEVPKNLPIA
ncbi:hypothetical protein HY477_03160 [Candidatus Uhrbacteria bacterium]|nr:hypothetical protein [Candidatus Uhrbacteria bacterium]